MPEMRPPKGGIGICKHFNSQYTFQLIVTNVFINYCVADYDAYHIKYIPLLRKKTFTYLRILFYIFETPNGVIKVPEWGY